MVKWGKIKSGTARTLLALVLSYLVAFQAIAISHASTRTISAAPQSFEAMLAGALCSEASASEQGSNPSNGPKLPLHGQHCLLCQLAQSPHGGMGPVTTPVAYTPPSRHIVSGVASAQNHTPAPEAGWASSWSSRAPPFHA